MDYNSEVDGIVWHLVNKYIGSKRFKRSTNRTKEDLFSEARVAAMIAISKYDASKSACLKTFVAACVRNRLEDLARREDASPELYLVEDGLVELEGTAYNNIEDVEFNLTMKALLSELEYRVYFKSFVEDMSTREVSKSLGISLRRVNTCLRHILRSFASLETSRDKILTQIELQRRWLEPSPV